MKKRKRFFKIYCLIIFKNYREKIWNGSRRKKNIKCDWCKNRKKNIWKHNDVNKYSILTLGYGTYHSNKKNNITQNIIRDRLNILLERNHFYSIWRPNSDNYIDQEYIYSPKIIQKGLFLKC